MMSPLAAIPVVSQIAEGFAYALKWLADLCGGSYGWAIILLTVGMRLVLLPLTIKQTKSMIAMQRLQPQLKEIQKKYKDDREKQGQEMMALYKENKVSPFGGCLPLLLQLPIIFALFEVLRNLAPPKKGTAPSAVYKILSAGTTAAALTQSMQFMGMDLTHVGSTLWTKDHDYIQLIILILLTVVTGYVSAKMMTTDPKQSKIMALMPVLMGVFAWILPAGVTIYIITTNILTIIQQYVQLEVEGFYDELRSQKYKDGWPKNWYQRLGDKSLEFGSKALIAIKIKKPPAKPPKKKAASAKDAGKKQEKGPVKKQQDIRKKVGSPEEKATASRKAVAEKPGKSEQEKKTEPTRKAAKPGQKDQARSYPAKKKGTGKK